jgi:hypothetical protein
LLQSIGGGGGALLSGATTPRVTLSSDNIGDGGTIQFAQIGNIATAGTATYGLFAQSLGVAADSSWRARSERGRNELGGAITLTVDGDVITMGDRSTALFAQSTGRAGGDDINVSIAAGRHIVGGTNGTAMTFDGGSSNVFENLGSVMTLSGVTGAALPAGPVTGDRQSRHRDGKWIWGRRWLTQTRRTRPSIPARA